jgi:hypothetical protein
MESDDDDDDLELKKFGNINFEKNNNKIYFSGKFKNGNNLCHAISLFRILLTTDSEIKRLIMKEFKDEQNIASLFTGKWEEKLESYMDLKAEQYKIGKFQDTIVTFDAVRSLNKCGFEDFRISSCSKESFRETYEGYSYYFKFVLEKTYSLFSECFRENINVYLTKKFPKYVMFDITKNNGKFIRKTNQS